MLELIRSYGMIKKGVIDYEKELLALNDGR